MITVKLKIHDSRFNEFLEAIQKLDDGIIKNIDYKLPKPKQPKVIYKPYTFEHLNTFQDLVIKDNSIIFEDREVKTIQLIGKYKTLINMINRKGLTIAERLNDNSLNEVIKSMENIEDNKFRLHRDKFKPNSEVMKFSDLTIMIITKNIPLLFDYAIEHKKAKDTYCLITIMGLEHLKNENIFNRVLSFIKRKAFKLYKINPF